MSNVTAIKEAPEYRIFAVKPTELYRVWLEVEPYLARVVEHAHDDITLHSTRNNLITGKLQLFCIQNVNGEIHACFCTDVQVMESGLRTLRVPIISGTEMSGWEDLFIATIRKLGQEMMCDRVRGLGRPGWRKAWAKFGLHPVYTAYELTPEQE